MARGTALSIALGFGCVIALECQRVVDGALAGWQMVGRRKCAERGLLGGMARLAHAHALFAWHASLVIVARHACCDGRWRVAADVLDRCAVRVTLRARNQLAAAVASMLAVQKAEVADDQRAQPTRTPGSLDVAFGAASHCRRAFDGRLRSMTAPAHGMVGLLESLIAACMTIHARDVESDALLHQSEVEVARVRERGRECPMADLRWIDRGGCSARTSRVDVVVAQRAESSGLAQEIGLMTLLAIARCVVVFAGQCRTAGEHVAERMALRAPCVSVLVVREAVFIRFDDRLPSVGASTTREWHHHDACQGHRYDGAVGHCFEGLAASAGPASASLLGCPPSDAGCTGARGGAPAWRPN